MNLSEKGLLPCPFCGGDAEIVHIDEGENAGGSCVCCTSCLASGDVEFEFKENFISNWNRRAYLQAAGSEEAVDWLKGYFEFRANGGGQDDAVGAFEAGFNYALAATGAKP